MIRDGTSAWKCIDNDKINQTKWPHKRKKCVYSFFATSKMKINHTF